MVVATFMMKPMKDVIEVTRTTIEGMPRLLPYAV